MYTLIDLKLSECKVTIREKKTNISSVNNLKIFFFQFLKKKKTEKKTKNKINKKKQQKTNELASGK